MIIQQKNDNETWLLQVYISFHKKLRRGTNACILSGIHSVRQKNRCQTMSATLSELCNLTLDRMLIDQSI